MPALPVTARNLVKRYGSFTAVDGVSFDIREGECFGMLGPNGAGKSTTIKMITCFSPVTEGELVVRGNDVRTQAREIKSVLGLVPQEDNLDPDLPVRRNLEIYARYFGIPQEVASPRIEESLRLFQLEEKASSKVDDLSGGMKRRLLLAKALVHRP
ncbi:MAG: ABC transporter ATP-binding protein, partial [Dehalococcoidia bacterium]|nr:ABC transporter ATP-binding protein [Dehalococcoidia bacterium]